MKTNHKIENEHVKVTQESTASSGRILLVDDDLYIRELYSAPLIRSGYYVDTMTDGAEAWQALQDHSYDLLVTDYKMPKVTRLELIKKLRLAGIKLLIILISGTMPTGELKRDPELQPEATLAKPITITELLDTVKNVLRVANGAAKNTRDYAILDKHILKIEESTSRPITD